MVLWRVCSELETYRAQAEIRKENGFRPRDMRQLGSARRGPEQSTDVSIKMAVPMQLMVPEVEVHGGLQVEHRGQSRAQLSHIRRPCSFTAEAQPQVGGQQQDPEGGTKEGTESKPRSRVLILEGAYVFG